MHERKLRMRALETSCYVAGAGAFSVFIRWLQTMLAYNDERLVDGSIFNFLVPAIAVAAAFLFRYFIKKFKRERYYIPEDFFEAFKNSGKVYTVLRWLICAVMVLGSLMLLMECEVDKETSFLRVLSLMGAAAGLSFPILVTSANKPHVTKPSTTCLLASVPIIFYSFWLITCYKINAINPVLWDYAMEVFTLIVCILSFFYLAGFAYDVLKPWRAMFFAMLGCAMCVMMMADERYLGMQLMYLAGAAMQLYFVWIMICNMGQKEKEFKVQPEDGFEHL